MNRAQRRHQAAVVAEQPAVDIANAAAADLLRRAAQTHQAGNLRAAELAYGQVLDRQPDNADALRLLALLAHQVGRDDLAEPMLLRALDLRPGDALLYADLGNVHAGLGQHAQALSDFERALTINPQNLVALSGIGNVLYALGELETAATAQRQAVGGAPNDPEAHLNLGNTQLAMGLVAEALQSYQQAAVLAPNDARILSNVGAAWGRQGNIEQAIAWYHRALNINPDQYEALTNLGSALLSTDRPEQAAAIFARAAAAEPDRATAHTGLAAAHLNLYRIDEALVSSARALSLSPQDDKALETLADGLRLTGHYQEAIDAYQQLLQLHPTGASAFKLATVLPVIAESPQQIVAARKRYTQALKHLNPDLTLPNPLGQDRSAFFLAYHGLNDRTLQVSLAKAMRDAAPELEFVVPHCATATPIGNRKVRVGFASSYLHDHTIGRLTRGFIEQLDRTNFEVTVVHLRGSRHDAFAEAMDAVAERALWLTGTLPELQQGIAALELDVLIYPEAGMESAAYALAFARLAPVQCAMWGHPDTTGIPTMDYFLSSTALEPTGASRHYSERLVAFERLPTYYHRPEVPAVPRTRAEFGFDAGDHLYVCPQSLFKLHPEFDAVLADILQQDPHGRLVLLEGMSAHWSALLHERFARSMPAVADRVTFLPPQRRDDFLSLLLVADAVLDPLHFGGGNSTYEALALGVPVVTVPGAFMRGRVTGGCYRQMGIPELTADSKEEYVAKALRLANEPDWRCEVRGLIAERSNRLFEDTAAVRELEAFMVKALQTNS